MSHVSVLLKESIDGLNIQPGDVYVDGTLGDGGHCAEVLNRFGSRVKIIGIDRDQDAIDRNLVKFRAELAPTGPVSIVRENFRNVDAVLTGLGQTHANRFMFDVGMSSRQIEESGRGFSFHKNEPLLMTFEKSVEAAASTGSGVTAQEVVNEWEEENLKQIIWGFGEEKFAGKIAKGIVEARKQKKIETTTELVDIILKSTPIFYRFGRIHPATRTFQAIRIAVNDELTAISEGLKAAWGMLAPQGRIAIISFHSLEDRIVKHYFNELKAENVATIITKRPIVAGEAETIANPRARSAKLRIIEKK